MLKKIRSASVISLLYFLIANVGNLFFDHKKSMDWTSTIWETLFFFIFIFLLLQFRNESKDSED